MKLKNIPCSYQNRFQRTLDFKTLTPQLVLILVINMIPVDLKNINEQIVSRNSFQSNRVESLTHDYKREIGLTNSEKEKVQFLKNVTSFANAQGGDLIVGIDEQH
ncbi:MAG: putative DNA binding domain-containing protein [Saprospirales bacterium]|nr:putative DNA binding domain-containing protein [Saprospirales bacterium]